MFDRAARSKAAYSLVDMSELDPEIRQELTNDALAGGAEYGIRVVEEVHNGPAIAPIFGFYHADQEKWDQAKKDFGIGGAEVADNTVVPGTVDITDPRELAMLRQAAAQQAQAQADAVNTMEEDEIRKVLEGEGEAIPANSPNRLEPNANTADVTLNKSADRPATPKKHK